MPRNQEVIRQWGLAELEGARQQYVPQIELEVPRVVLDRRRQRLLPFRRGPGSPNASGPRGARSRRPRAGS